MLSIYLRKVHRNPILCAHCVNKVSLVSTQFRGTIFSIDNVVKQLLLALALHCRLSFDLLRKILSLIDFICFCLVIDTFVILGSKFMYSALEP